MSLRHGPGLGGTEALADGSGQVMIMGTKFVNFPGLGNPYPPLSYTKRRLNRSKFLPPEAPGGVSRTSRYSGVTHKSGARATFQIDGTLKRPSRIDD